MRRREFIALAACAAAGAALARRHTVAAELATNAPRIGVLLPGSAGTAARDPRMQVFYQALRDFGWIEGQNIAFERRYAEGQFERLAGLAAELARLNVNVIVTASYPPAGAAKAATGTVPIVIMDPGDPVATGLVGSLAHPGGNVTGVSSVAPDLAAIRVRRECRRG